MNTENCPLSRWRRRKEVRPSEILDAALQLFIDKGFKATKMEDIAKAAGVTKGTPYLYFDNKEEIFKAVVRENLVSRVSALQQMAQRHEGSCEEILKLMMRSWWHEVGESPLAGICKLVISEATNFPDLARYYNDQVIEPSHAMLRELIERGMSSGEFRQLNADAVVDTIVAPMLMTMIWRCSIGQAAPHSNHRTLPPVEYLEQAVDIMLGGLKSHTHTHTIKG